MIPYRSALMGIGAGVLYLGIWLYQAGISLPLILFLFASCFVCMTGSSEFSPKGLVTLGFSYGWTMTRFQTVMAHAQGALRLVREKGGLVATTYMTLKLGYTRGGLNSDRFFFRGALLPFNAYIGGRMLQPSPIYTQGLTYLGLGVGIAALLTLLGTRFVWWPLHPVALPVSTIAYTDVYFFSVFLAWEIKSLVLKLGGARLYQSTRPIFVGVVLGEAVCAGEWVVVDAFTGMTGNNLTYW